MIAVAVVVGLESTVMFTLVSGDVNTEVFLAVVVKLPALKVRELLVLLADEAVEVLRRTVRFAGKVGVKSGGGAEGGAAGTDEEDLLPEVLVPVEESLVIPGILPRTDVLLLLAIDVGVVGVVGWAPGEGVLVGISRFGEELGVGVDAVVAVGGFPEADGLANSNSPCCPL